MEDKQILALLLRRAEEAIGALDERFGKRLHTTAIGLLSDRQDAEECVNDTYLAIWNTIPPRKPEPLAPFVYRVGRNIALNRLRRNTALKRGGYVLSLDELAGCIPAPCQEDGRALGQAIDAFLDTLRKEDRVIFLRRYWFGGEAGYEAALAMVELLQHPNMSDDTHGRGHTDLLKGELGAYMSGFWDYPLLEQTLGEDLGVAVFPTVMIGGEAKQLRPLVHTTCAGVAPNGAYPELAMEFAAFLASTESQMLRYTMCGVIPAAVTLLDDPLIAADPLAVVQIRSASEIAVPQTSFPETDLYWDPIHDLGAKAVSGEMDENDYRQHVDRMMERFAP